MQIADTIKELLSMRDVAERYGFHPDRSGFVRCPFHADKTASLKIYEDKGRGYHCFGCGSGGSVIDFAMALFQITFSQAIVRLNADFSLGLTNECPDMRQVEKMRAERAEAERAIQERRAEYDGFNRLYRDLWAATRTRAKTEADGPIYAAALATMDRLDLWFSENHWKR